MQLAGLNATPESSLEMQDWEGQGGISHCKFAGHSDNPQSYSLLANTREKVHSPSLKPHKKPVNS